MKEVICPKCKTAFTIDENNFAFLSEESHAESGLKCVHLITSIPIGV